MRFVSPEEAVASIGDGHTIFVQGGAATPTALLAALAARAPELADVTTVGLHLEGPCPHLEPGMAGHILTSSRHPLRVCWEGSVARYELDVPRDLSGRVAA